MEKDNQWTNTMNTLCQQIWSSRSNGPIPRNIDICWCMRESNQLENFNWCDWYTVYTAKGKLFEEINMIALCLVPMSFPDCFSHYLASRGLTAGASASHMLSSFRSVTQHHTPWRCLMSSAPLYLTNSHMISQLKLNKDVCFLGLLIHSDK